MLREYEVCVRWNDNNLRFTFKAHGRIEAAFMCALFLASQFKDTTGFTLKSVSEVKGHA